MFRNASILLLTLLSSCGSAEVEQPGPPPVDPRVYQPTAARATAPRKSPLERDRGGAEAFERAVGDGDTKALTELLDPDVDFSFPGMPNATNRPGTLQAIGDLFGAFSPRKLTTSRIWQIGEVTVVEWTLAGAHASAFMGVAPTQKPISFRGLTLLWFSLTGLVNDAHIYFDCGAIVAALGAPVNPTVQAGPPSANVASAPILAGGTPEEKANVAAVNASWDAFEAKNEAGYLAPIAEDVEVTRLDRAAPERGKEERKKFFRTVTTGMSSLSQTPLNAWGAGSLVIEEYTLSGVHSGKLTPGAPSGHALRLHYVDIDEMVGGKIVRTWTYGNSLELYAEAGAVPSAVPGSTASAATAGKPAAK